MLSVVFLERCVRREDHRAPHLGSFFRAAEELDEGQCERERRPCDALYYREFGLHWEKYLGRGYACTKLKYRSRQDEETPTL